MYQGEVVRYGTKSHVLGRRHLTIIPTCCSARSPEMEDRGWLEEHRHIGQKWKRRQLKLG